MWQPMLKETQMEKAAAERAWVQVIEDRQRIKEEWAAMDKIARDGREMLQGRMPLQSGFSQTSLSPRTIGASPQEDDGEFQAKMKELHKLERAQLEQAWQELRTERKGVQESLRKSREMHAEVALMLKQAKGEAERGTASPDISPISNRAPQEMHQSLPVSVAINDLSGR
jgi:hypothetical protein